MHRDTVYLTVVDRDRNVVSFINSIFACRSAAASTRRSPASCCTTAAPGSRSKRGIPNRVGGRGGRCTLIPALLLRAAAANVVRRDGRTVPGGGGTHFLTHVLDRGWIRSGANGAAQFRLRRDTDAGADLRPAVAANPQVPAVTMVSDDPIGGARRS